MTAPKNIIMNHKLNSSRLILEMKSKNNFIGNGGGGTTGTIDNGEEMDTALARQQKIEVNMDRISMCPSSSIFNESYSTFSGSSSSSSSSNNDLLVLEHFDIDDTLTLALSFGKVDRSRSSVYRWDDKNLQHTKVVIRRNERAIIKIQAFVRRVLCQSRYRKKPIQSMFRRLIQVRNTNVIIIQSVARRYLARIHREQTEVETIRNARAVQIQSRIRVYLAKVERTVMILERQLETIDRDKQKRLERIEQCKETKKQKFMLDITGNEREANATAELIVTLKQTNRKMKNVMVEYKRGIKSLKQERANIKDRNKKLGKERGKLELLMEQPLLEQARLQKQIDQYKRLVDDYTKTLRRARLKYLLEMKQKKILHSAVIKIVKQTKKRCKNSKLVKNVTRLGGTAL